MVISSTTFTRTTFCLLTAYSLLLTSLNAQEVETLELTTSGVQPITARLGNASLIQLPIEPIATNVGDPTSWLVERTEHLVSIKPIQANARPTNLAIVTRQGTLNFSVRLAPDSENFTQMIRVTKIMDDSKPLPIQQSSPQETLTDTIIREIRIVQNYYALKLAHSLEIRDVEQVTQMRETEIKTYSLTLLQSFRFRDTRHIILHFITENKTSSPISFDQRRTTVNVGDSLFAPIAVSLGKVTLFPKASTEDFIVLNGSNGLSPRQKFKILLVELP